MTKQLKKKMYLLWIIVKKIFWSILKTLPPPGD